MRSIARRGWGTIGTLLLAAAIVAAPALCWAGGGEKATPLENVADTRAMSPGFLKFMADTYNANLWLFGLYVVVIMACMGAILGFGVDKLLSFTGIGLGKIEHHE
ncbi:MAG TPA: hypothetical protein VGQ83_38915 [Polyangia bacterium]|jgi:hypothetical protein